MPAPTRPPTRAWLLLDGMPSHHVSTFQTIAPVRAPNTTSRIDDAGVENAVSHRGGDVQAEHREGDEVEEGAESTAVEGRNTRVETTVAIELALSCRPLRKSNSSATAIRPTSDRRADRESVHRAAVPQTCSTTMPSITFDTSSQRSTTASTRS